MLVVLHRLLELMCSCNYLQAHDSPDLDAANANGTTVRQLMQAAVETRIRDNAKAPGGERCEALSHHCSLLLCWKFHVHARFGLHFRWRRMSQLPNNPSRSALSIKNTIWMHYKYLQDTTMSSI